MTGCWHPFAICHGDAALTLCGWIMGGVRPGRPRCGQPNRASMSTAPALLVAMTSVWDACRVGADVQPFVAGGTWRDLGRAAGRQIETPADSLLVIGLTATARREAEREGSSPFPTIPTFAIARAIADLALACAFLHV